MHPYLRRVMSAAMHDRVVNRALLKVMNLESPPSSLLHPRVMLRALRGDRTAVPAAIDVR
jgi:hypothetical protein